MSLVDGHFDLVREASEPLERPNGNTAVINLTLHGNFYYKNTINNSGSANLGNLGNMCKLLARFRRWSKDSTAQRPTKRLNSPPQSFFGSNPVTGELERKSLTCDPNEPNSSEYRIRRIDWFTPGRVFTIWGPGDTEIHEKTFVLLDTQNKEGPGLLVHVYTEEEEKQDKGYFYRSHVLLGNSKPSKPQHDQESHPNKMTVFMDEYVQGNVEERNYVELDHQYNIPFEKYQCIDHGVLGRSSLRQLRICFLNWRSHKWEIKCQIE